MGWDRTPSCSTVSWVSQMLLVVEARKRFSEGPESPTEPATTRHITLHVHMLCKNTCLCCESKRERQEERKHREEIGHTLPGSLTCERFSEFRNRMFSLLLSPSPPWSYAPCSLTWPQLSPQIWNFLSLKDSGKMLTNFYVCPPRKTIPACSFFFFFFLCFLFLFFHLQRTEVIGCTEWIMVSKIEMVI